MELLGDKYVKAVTESMMPTGVITEEYLDGLNRLRLRLGTLHGQQQMHSSCRYIAVYPAADRHVNSQTLDPPYCISQLISPCLPLSLSVSRHQEVITIEFLLHLPIHPSPSPILRLD